VILSYRGAAMFFAASCLALVEISVSSCTTIRSDVDFVKDDVSCLDIRPGHSWMTVELRTFVTSFAWQKAGKRSARCDAKTHVSQPA